MHKRQIIHPRDEGHGRIGYVRSRSELAWAPRKEAIDQDLLLPGRQPVRFIPVGARGTTDTIFLAVVVEIVVLCTCAWVEVVHASKVFAFVA